MTVPMPTMRPNKVMMAICPPVDDLYFVRHHDFGDLGFFQAFSQHDIDFVVDVGIALDADEALFLFR